MRKPRRPALGATMLAVAFLVGALALPTSIGARSAPSSPTSAAQVPVGPLGSNDGVGSLGSAPPTFAPPVPAPTGPLGTASVGRADREASTVAAIEGAGVPMRYAFLPDLSRLGAPAPARGVVVPTYSGAPAPIGVGDFGVVNRSGTLVASNLSTPRLEGAFAPAALTGLSIGTSSPDVYGVQLNAVLRNVTLLGNASYSFWTQNVAEYSPSSDQLTLIDNLWNFSDSAGQLSYNVLESHGPNGTQVGTTYYYALGPTISIGYPFALRLYLNSSVEGNADTVSFNYTVSNATVHRAGSFDEIQFNNLGSGPVVSPPPPAFLADGSQLNALGLPDDFEMVVGGPGGGSNFDAWNASAAINLYYWNVSHGAFEVVPSAFDVGGDTGETVAGLSSTWNPGADLALGGTSGPAAELGAGPGFVHGEWNVTDSTAGTSLLHLGLLPGNGFLFVAPGAAPALSTFQWLPPDGPYPVPPGTYTVVALASHFDPQTAVFTATGPVAWANVTLVPDAATGVYTPLWAFSSAGLVNISSPCTAGACTLWTDEAGPLGQPANGGAWYPWFGTHNDFLYPEFAGVLLEHAQRARLASPPALTVVAPPWQRNASVALGVPSSNGLPIVFEDDADITVTSATFASWWFTGAYFGAAAAEATVVFWNTSSSTVTNSTFLSGAEGLYFYGGTGNVVTGDSFVGYAPLAADPGTIAGSAYGTTGLFDADFGTGDVVYNNAFGTYFTAVEPAIDPYTGRPPSAPFDTRWNATPQPGLNIAGGTGISGNYWWDYGAATNPYWILPYNATGAISAGGDFRPVLLAPLWKVTFAAAGLPPTTAWEVGIETNFGYATSKGTGANLTQLWPSGQYFVEGGSLNGSYGLSSAQVIRVAGANLTINLTLYRLFGVTFLSVGLPPGGFWTVTLWNPLGSWIDLGNVPDFPTTRLPAGVYNFTISAPPGYVGTPSSGTIDLARNSTVQIAFGPVGAPGYLAGTVASGTPASLWVDGQSVGLAGGGAFNVTLVAGVHAVEATAPGYLPYFNNVSVSNGRATALSIVLTVAPGNGGPFETLFVVAVAGAAALAAVAGVVYVRARRRPPAPPPVPVGLPPSR